MLGIPKSTLSNWLSGILLSQEANTRLKSRLSIGFIRRNKEQTIHAQKRARDIRTVAASEVQSISDNDLLIIGTALYWAEGYKRLRVINNKEVTSHVVGLTNSDPVLVRVFIMFLRNVLKVPIEKVFIDMRLFPHIDAKEAIEYWMNAIDLPRSQFRKPCYPMSAASKGIRPKNRLPYGTVQVIVSDTKLFHRIIGLIEGVKERLQQIPINKDLPR